ncbi:MAG: hypothetical protein WAM39_13750 [Bryobacteraceae bacterium]
MKATGGQCEIYQRFDTLVKSADNMMLYKYIIRSVSISAPFSIRN